jgi:hypothetical protein
MESPQEMPLRVYVTRDVLERREYRFVSREVLHEETLRP